MTTPTPHLPPYKAPPADNVTSFYTNVSWMSVDHQRLMTLFDEARTLVGPAYYIGDNLFTWGRNNSLFDDEAFRRSWESNVQGEADQAIAWRRFILATMAHHAVQLPGDFVECGVYIGSGVKTVIDYLGGPAFPKTFWGFDTFDYNPVEGHAFEGQGPGLYEQVCARFADYPQVRLVRGLIPEIFAECCPESISFLHIDLNNAAGEIAALDYLFDRVVPGGVVIFDDYEWAGVYRAQKLAEDPWLDARGYRAVPLPTGQAFVIKR